VIAARLASHARPVFRLAAARWRHQPQLRWIMTVAPRVLADLEGTPEDRWRAETAMWTGTSVAIAVVTDRQHDRRLIVKIPATVEAAASLRRQVRVLSALADDPRLRDWEATLPLPVHEGEVAGRYYCVEAALPGEQAARLLRRDDHAGQALLDASARLIGGLHSRTAQERRVDQAAVAAWVDRPVQQLERFAATRPRSHELLPSVERLRDHLSGSLLGRTARLSWIHGDFWSGNILASSQSRRITGLVDWDQATRDQLRLHDLLHLYLYARRLRRGEELGEIVVGALTVGLPTVIGVPAGQVDAWTDGMPPRSALLLYWLRHVTLFLDSDGHRDNRYWLRNNVERVLAHV
jgi:aminoglycoside phosphotransferase (APT) family kinase protein